LIVVVENGTTEGLVTGALLGTTELFEGACTRLSVGNGVGSPAKEVWMRVGALVGGTGTLGLTVGSFVNAVNAIGVLELDAGLRMGVDVGIIVGGVNGLVVSGRTNGIPVCSPAGSLVRVNGVAVTGTVVEAKDGFFVGVSVGIVVEGIDVSVVDRKGATLGRVDGTIVISASTT
jgi:hypothetical protein